MSKTGAGGRIESLWAELRRRRVIRVVVIYLVAGWAVIEIASTVLPNLNVPDWAVTLVTVLVALGFVLAVALAWVFDVEPGGIQRTPATEDAPRARASEAAPDEPLPEAAGDDRRAVAVLPFVNMSGDPENEYFSDGIAEEILNLLTKLPQLRVASRTSSFKFKGKDIDIPEVAKTLGVGTILEGSVRRAGDRVRITSQLIDVRTDSHLWSETYDRELKDVFAIQDDIARSIVAALEVKLTPRDRRALSYVATSDTKAYDYYLRGRQYFYKITRLHFYNAIRMFKKAIEQDPNFALAYAGMADAYSLLYQWADSSEENIAKANEASIKAITLDPDSAEAHASRGTALAISRKHEEAERAFENAILLNPALYEPYYFYGRDCLAQGKFEKAARLFTEACKINPDDYQAPSFLAMAYTELGREKERMEATRRTLECVERHVDLHPDDGRALTFGAYALVEMGQPDRARDWAERALEADRDEPAIVYNVACMYSLLGENDRSFELLDRAISHGYGHRAWLEHDSDLMPLRDDPRFQVLLERLS
ncbi:MAG: tetratricopeptide repeat protein [Xanthomonadales bacterium]|nr:tetratricopeptide repeat protein [Xanthomonadales bacterium]